MTSQNFHRHFDVSGKGPPCSTIFMLKLLTAGYRSDQHQTGASLSTREDWPLGAAMRPFRSAQINRRDLPLSSNPVPRRRKPGSVGFWRSRTTANMRGQQTFVRASLTDFDQ